MSLRGGHEKRGIYLNKLILKLILRSNIRYIIENRLFITADAFKQRLECLQGAASVEIFVAVFEQVQVLPKLAL